MLGTWLCVESSTRFAPHRGRKPPFFSNTVDKWKPNMCLFNNSLFSRIRSLGFIVFSTLKCVSNVLSIGGS